MAEKTLVASRVPLHDGFGRLETIVFRRRRRDGAMAELTREILDTGDGVAILPYDPARGTVILVRQFRGVAFLHDGRESLLEVCAGKLEGADPATRARKELEEETGIRLNGEPRRLFEAYSTPGSFCERLTYFVAPYSAEDRIGPGGGLVEEGEDIEVLELDFHTALAMAGRGEINDSKTLLLLYWAEANRLFDAGGA